MHIDTLFECVLKQPSQILVPASWGQGQTTFGGLSAAMLLLAMQQKIPQQHNLLSITTGFSSVLRINVPFSIQVNLHKQGRSVSQIEAAIIQEGLTCVKSQACFAQPRPSTMSITAAQQISLPKSPSQAIQYIPDVTPICLQHFDLNLTLGDKPFSSSIQTQLGGWMRFSIAPNSLTWAHVLALTDAWPPAMLPMLTKPAPASTLVWSMDFFKHYLPQADTYLGYMAKVDHIQNGYGYTQATITDQQGFTLAHSRQTVSVYDQPIS